MIIEGLLTTIGADGAPHVAPMGPVVNLDLTQWTLRPFQSSTTFKLLRANPDCVFHVVDDVLPVVQAALGLPLSLDFERLVGKTADSDSPGSENCALAIASACHWYRLQVVQWDISQMRSEAKAEVVDSRVLRPFWGWNRAKHAILEATILATRLHLADRKTIDDDLAKLAVTIEKTAGPREQQAWRLLQQYVAEH